MELVNWKWFSLSCILCNKELSVTSIVRKRMSGYWNWVPSNHRIFTKIVDRLSAVWQNMDYQIRLSLFCFRQSSALPRASTAFVRLSNSKTSILCRLPVDYCTATLQINRHRKCGSSKLCNRIVSFNLIYIR